MTIPGWPWRVAHEMRSGSKSQGPCAQPVRSIGSGLVVVFIAVCFPVFCAVVDAPGGV